MIAHSRFENGRFLVEEDTHEGLYVDERDGRFYLRGWAENWDDTWGWESELTEAEVEAILADPSLAREMLATARTWKVRPPSSVPRAPYTKEGQLGDRDGYSDGGRGGKW